MNNVFTLFIFLAACFAQVFSSSAEQVASRIVNVRDYDNMLTAVATHDPLQLYSDEMAADPAGCGILRTETPEGYSYTMIAGMEDQPMKKLSQEQQDYYSHWVEQGSLQGEEEITSPLMMFQEHGKEDPEEAKKKLALEQQQQQRNRQTTDEEESDSSNSQERGQGPAASKEKSDYPPPIAEIRINTLSDDISEMTGDCTTADSNHHSLHFSPKGGVPNTLLQQAENKLRLAREEVSAARQHFDVSQAQWKALQNLERASKNHDEFQQQLGLAFNHYQQATATFQQAQATAYKAWNSSDPSYADLNQIVIRTGTEVSRTFQAHQATLFQAQAASNHYFFAQQDCVQQGLVLGVDYTSIFNEAQLRANRAADQLDKWQETVRRIKFEKPSTPKQKETGALPRKITAPVLKEQAVQIVEKTSERKAGELEPEIQGRDAVSPQKRGGTSTSLETDSDEISYKDQGTQISEEDFAAWKHEAFLKQQAYWKKIFHQMGAQVKQVKKAVAVDFSKLLLHEVSQEFVSNVAQTSLTEEQHAVAVSETKKALRGIVNKIVKEEEADKERQAAVALEVTSILQEIVKNAEKTIAEKAEKMALVPTIADALIEEALSAKWAKTYFKKIAKEAKRELLVEQQQAEEKLHLEKRESIFKQLFFSEGETTEREKWEQQQESASSIRYAREQQRAEMEKFCAERLNLLRSTEGAREKEGGQQAEAKDFADIAAPIMQRVGDILTQSYRRSYEWCSDAVHLIQDQRVVLSEAKRITDKFFADQGQRIIDVPTAEYAWKSGLVAQELYNEVVAKRRREEAAPKRNKDPREELGYFEQLPLMLEGPIFRRFVANFFEKRIYDPNRESDERAIDYFKEIGKPDPRIFEFWKKSAEIEEGLKKERLEKAKEFVEQFPDEEERLRVANEWGLGWRERLQQEREEKKNATLERDLFAKEEQRQRIVQAVIDRKAAEEAKRQKITKELLDQEAKGKEQGQNTKKNNSKKK